MRSRRKAAESVGPAALATAEVLLSHAGDTPEIPGSSSTDEAFRLKAVYDARKSRLAAEMEQLRVDIERGRLLTLDVVKARDLRWNEAVNTRLDLVERLLDNIDGLTPDQRRAFLDRSRAWRIESKRILSTLHV